MLERMSASQFAKWKAYMRMGTPDRETLPLRVGTGRLGREDWKRMRPDERKQTSKDLYGMVKTWAVLQGGQKGKA